MVKKTKKFFFFSPIFAFLIVTLLLFSFGPKVLAQNDLRSFSKAESPKKLRTIIQHRFRPACGSLSSNSVHCFAKIVTLDDGVTPLAGGTPSPSSLSPLQLHTAYQLPCQPGGPVAGACSTPSQFGPQTIAIVDAYHTPNIESDLNIYSNYFGIAQCTKANGCLTVVNQNGGGSLPFTIDSGWAMETSLDVEVAHAICQTCKILLVEANSNRFSDLTSGVNTAASLGVTAISNSYGGSEFFDEKNDTSYNHPGIAVTASAGDSGYRAEYPASSPYVVGVGGTTLNLYTDNSYSSESVWSGTGSGCSFYENANSWQASLSNWGQTGCVGKRGVSDISAVADPNTGAAVYDSTPYSGQSGWWQVGGTSLSSPIIAAAFALAGGVAQNTQAGQVLYANFNSSNFHDITSGTNGICGTIMCSASLGFDGPTGLGTLNGLGGFGLLSSITPTPTSTPTPTLSPSPTSTPAPTLTPTPTPPDIQAPTVSITNPLNGSTVRHGYNVTISASASDNVGVSKVEFYINNSLLSTDTNSPYRASWRVPYPRNIQYVITAKAYDAAGNFSTSSITVTSR